MFSIVSMQDVLINLKGDDDLFRLFDRLRPRKRANVVVKGEVLIQSLVWYSFLSP